MILNQETKNSLIIGVFRELKMLQEALKNGLKNGLKKDFMTNSVNNIEKGLNVIFDTTKGESEPWI
jgi:hypothetical protein